MINRPFNQLSLGCRVTLMVLATITLPGMLIVQTIVARAYYRLNSQSLQLIALMAVKVGAGCLPANPRAAVRIADAFARDHGIAPAEIVFTQLSPDNSVLTIRLDRKIPSYLAVLAMGGLPARDIKATASAWQRGAGKPFGTRILDVPVPNGAGTGRKIILITASPCTTSDLAISQPASSSNDSRFYTAQSAPCFG